LISARMRVRVVGRLMWMIFERIARGRCMWFRLLALRMGGDGYFAISSTNSYRMRGTSCQGRLHEYGWTNDREQ
jgi:hypothetical protein